MNVVKLTDEDLADKFRCEFTEQFHILVRMHLSFVLDLHTDENNYLNDKTKFKKWKLVPFSKKVKSSDLTEGAPLTQEGVCQIYQLIEYLKKEPNLQIEGIFRRTGSLNRQNELKSLLNQGVTIDLDNSAYSVHDCASVLKGFLSELPDPLLTETHFPAYCQIAELCGVIEKPTQEEKLLEALQLILLLLPSVNRILLKDILNLLHLTASYESSNKMSPENLATLFTPHLLCPRKLSAEQLHSNSQSLSGIIAFMITHCGAIFKLPPKLVLDFRVRFEKKVLKSNLYLNESVSDPNAANTVFTFLDIERTAKENETNTTETALAQLYAYIQSLPESSKKRKLVKQFNKENGHGTPLQVLRGTVSKNKSFGDSIKKHLLNRKLIGNIKKPGILQMRSSSEEILSTPPQGIISRARLFCTNCESSPEKNNVTLETLSKKPRLSSNKAESFSDLLLVDNPLRRSLSESNLANQDLDYINNCYLTSTPACFPSNSSCMDSLFTPNGIDRSSISPITRSTQRMPLAMQETMMTPRSRKPVLLGYGNNSNLPKIDSIQTTTNTECVSMIHETDETTPSLCRKHNSLTDTFREYLISRDLLTYSSSPKDLSFSSRTDDFTSNDELNDLSESKITKSLLECLDGKNLDCGDVEMESEEEKKLVLKPKKFDRNGQPIVFETSF